MKKYMSRRELVDRLKSLRTEMAKKSERGQFNLKKDLSGFLEIRDHIADLSLSQERKLYDNFFGYLYLIKGPINPEVIDITLRGVDEVIADLSVPLEGVLIDPIAERGIIRVYAFDNFYLEEIRAYPHITFVTLYDKTSSQILSLGDTNHQSLLKEMLPRLSSVDLNVASSYLQTYLPDLSVEEGNIRKRLLTAGHSPFKPINKKLANQVKEWFLDSYTSYLKNQVVNMVRQLKKQWGVYQKPDGLQDGVLHPTDPKTLKKLNKAKSAKEYAFQILGGGGTSISDVLSNFKKAYPNTDRLRNIVRKTHKFDDRYGYILDGPLLSVVTLSDILKK